MILMSIDTGKSYLTCDPDGEFWLHFWSDKRPVMLDGVMFTSLDPGAESIGPFDVDSLPRILPGQLVRVRIFAEIIGGIRDGLPVERADIEADLASGEADVNRGLPNGGGIG